MKTIEIKSTYRGMLSNQVMSLISIICLSPVLFLIAVKLSPWLYECVDATDINPLLGTGSLFLLAVALVSAVVLAIMILHQILSIFMAFYDPTNRITLKLNEHGEMTEIMKSAISFVWSRDSKISACDRILEVKVNKSTVETMLNTGTIEITFMCNSNATDKKATWEIEGVNNPDEMASLILKASSVHKGLKVYSE